MDGDAKREAIGDVPTLPPAAGWEGDAPASGRDGDLAASSCWLRRRLASRNCFSGETLAVDERLRSSFEAREDEAVPAAATGSSSPSSAVRSTTVSVAGNGDAIARQLARADAEPATEKLGVQRGFEDVESELKVRRLGEEVGREESGSCWRR